MEEVKNEQGVSVGGPREALIQLLPDEGAGPWQKLLERPLLARAGKGFSASLRMTKKSEGLPFQNATCSEMPSGATRCRIPSGATRCQKKTDW